MKLRLLLPALLLCAALLPYAAHAQLQFTLDPGTIVRQQGDTFRLTAEVINTNALGGASYMVDNYTLSVAPGTLSLPSDLNDDNTNFLANFQRDFNPQDDVNLPFLDFTIGSMAAPDTYTVTIELQDAASTGLAQQQFTLTILPAPALVPESGSLSLLAAGVVSLTGCGLIRRRRR